MQSPQLLSVAFEIISSMEIITYIFRVSFASSSNPARPRKSTVSNWSNKSANTFRQLNPCNSFAFFRVFPLSFSYPGSLYPLLSFSKNPCFQVPVRYYLFPLPASFLIKYRLNLRPYAPFTQKSETGIPDFRRSRIKPLGSHRFNSVDISAVERGNPSDKRENNLFLWGGKWAFIIFVSPNWRESTCIAASIGGGFCFTIHCQPSYFLELTLLARAKAASDLLAGRTVRLSIHCKSSLREKITRRPTFLYGISFINTRL